MDQPPVQIPIGLRLARTARAVSQAFERALADAGGSASTWQVLVLARAQRWGTQAQMAEAMGITPATLTHHLNAMEANGLVRRWREPGNRRVQRLELTEAGIAEFDRLRGAALAHDARLRDALAPDELTALDGMLQRLEAAIAGDP